MTRIVKCDGFRWLHNLNIEPAIPGETVDMISISLFLRLKITNIWKTMSWAANKIGEALYSYPQL